MDWNEIRTQHPGAWVVVEAVDAYSRGDRRIVNHLKVIEVFADDWEAAWACCETISRADGNKEYYVLHADRCELNIGVDSPFV